ncbi:MAG: type II toxin-antitoxin system HicA family toxin [Desulfobacteraceae bacterium]|nr:MAG: type II toxin-antitoxin system HicA family toxin [Desulfobacteraceae bacterium]
MRQLDFEGPYTGTRHQFMDYKEYRLTIPSNTEYSVPQLRMMINEVEGILGRTIAPDEWNSLS